MITVDEIMTSEIFTLPATATLADAIRIMAEKSIRHIPIVDSEGRPEGVISFRSVIRYLETHFSATAATV